VRNPLREHFELVPEDAASSCQTEDEIIEERVSGETEEEACTVDIAIAIAKWSGAATSAPSAISKCSQVELLV
jgi:hypothetical protein